MGTTSLFRRLAALALIAGLSLVACGDPSSSVAPPGGDSSSPNDPDGVVSDTPKPGDQQPGRTKWARIEPRPGMADLHRVAWQKAMVSANGKAVTLRFYIGVDPCYVLDHIDVDYGADAVKITLFEGHDPSAGDNVACIELAMAASTRVVLDEPLAGRPIVDGAK
jgi:hypothetical protein